MANPKKTKQETIDEELEKARHEAAPLPERRERPKGKVMSGTGYHKFDEQPIFEGYFLDKVLAEKDDPRFKTKKGDVIGFRFVDTDGAETKITNSDSIARALEADKYDQKSLWWIEFVEKRQIGTGKNKRSWNEFYLVIQNK